MPTLTRRSFFTPWRTLSEARPKPPEQLLARFLRPPGALIEEQFLAECTRCGDCQKACPADAIRPLSPAYGDKADTPALLPANEGCRLCTGLPCAAACGEGALRIVPLDEVRMGTAKLRPELCWSVRGQPCDYCLTACPLEQTAITWDNDRPRIDETRCTGCGMCEYFCTAHPKALHVAPAQDPGR